MEAMDDPCFGEDTRLVYFSRAAGRNTVAKAVEAIGPMRLKVQTAYGVRVISRRSIKDMIRA